MSAARIYLHGISDAFCDPFRPQQSGQANMTPEQGASLWRTYLEPLKSQSIRLGSPAPSSAPSGKAWLQDWLGACAGGCNPDFIALRASLTLIVSSNNIDTAMNLDWYGTNASWFQSYLEDFYSTFQLPIWVTEWACQVCSQHSRCIHRLG